MNAVSWFAAVVGAITLCSALTVWQTYRECRRYGLEPAFCISVVTR
jgi:hypothetical protein